MNRAGYIKAITERIKDRKKVDFDLEDGYVFVECKGGEKVSIRLADFDDTIDMLEIPERLEKRYPDGVPSDISDFWTEANHDTHTGN